MMDRELPESHHDRIQEKMIKAITPFHVLAYLTDPRYTEDSERWVDIDDETHAEQWLNDRDPSFYESYTLYKTKDPVAFPNYLFNKPIPAGTWWRNMQRKAPRCESLSLDFTILMTNLHQCPASSASIERWFSTVGFIWNKVRNKLGVERAQKLSTVYRHLRQPSPDL